MKICNQCGTRKPLVDFPPDKVNRDGRRGKCRECVLRRQRELRAENPARERQWVEANKSSVLESKRAYRKRNEERLRIETRERQRSRREDPGVAHKCREYARAYVKRRKCTKSWGTDAHALARDAVNKALKSGKLTKPEKCTACGSSGLIHGHHRSYAPEDWLDVVWLCTRCHGRAHRMADSVLEIRGAA
jgi:hypothetical protein